MHFERQQLSCRPREKEKHALPGLTWDWEVEAEEVAGAVVEPLVDGVFTVVIAGAAGVFLCTYAL
jgi:hypothetical protein